MAINKMYVGKAPCDDCRFFEKCKIEEVACKQFFKFVFDGEFFADAPRSPNHELFIKIFDDRDRSDIRALFRKLRGET